ncbi:MAG TPA: 16S rRNA (cytosine(1402)-N(4))-methyltransferase RsmH [Gemmatimonadales bacterium]|jgi:16S rRNA (cytosine1402-N4)-methyltransferase|nr:16S rRNA (cytosine(1402)-N(4))-methyltransferase RsmH [Gemmatimonadales bacterium]
MTAPAPSHLPVLLAPVVEAAGGARRAVDATLGHGGHADALLALGAEVLGIDRDPDALAIARARLGDRLATLEAAYGSDEALAAVRAFRPDFILLDLGVSSRQLDEDARGFTFRPGAPLDMRMARTGPTAADLLNEADEEDLARVFAEYGDERRARGLAREVARRRARAPFATSDDLVNAIRAVLGPQSGPADFARLFQAVRIAVNDELAGLARALPAFLEALVPGGRLAVIGYHSGEDRLVKHTFQEWARACVCPPAQPVCTCRGRPLGALTPRKPIVAGEAEVAANPRARSARLRIFRKAE